MLGRKITKINSILYILLFGVSKALVAEPVPLTLPEVERITIANAPELQRLEATSEAFAQQAIADGQLPDPKLVTGAVNVPANSFSFTQDDMTMVEIGVQQSFPPGDTLAIKSKQTQEKSNAEKRKFEDQKVFLVRTVREIWLNLYYWTQAAHVVRENQSLYRQLLKAAESLYSAGKGTLSDVTQAQLELSRLDDQVIQIQQQIDVLRAQLGRYIGKADANRPLSNSLPQWPNPLPLDTLETCLYQHPLLKVDAANVEVARNEVALANEQYKPGVMVDAGYGIRQGRFSCCGGRRSDMISASVTMDLPIFTPNRQDRHFQATSSQFTAAQLDRQIHYRDLLKDLRTQYDFWQRFAQRETLYEKQLVPEAKQNSKASLFAYQSATVEIASVLLAFSRELTIELEQQQIKAEGAKARAALFYLEGVTE
ncbi:MAG: transporter [Alphaproteobacteria bacterium 41-28]|nr:MAG: transporter [Alphaproteobacteria bacterium 41-28]